jgi:hypothetical protein
MYIAKYVVVASRHIGQQPRHNPTKLIVPDPAMSATGSQGTHLRRQELASSKVKAILSCLGECDDGPAYDLASATLTDRAYCIVLNSADYEVLADLHHLCVFVQRLVLPISQVGCLQL